MRTGITILAILLGLLAAFGAFMQSSDRQQQRLADQPAAATEEITQAPVEAEPAESTLGVTTDAAPTPAEAASVASHETAPVAATAPSPPVAVSELHLKPAQNSQTLIIGSDAQDSGFMMKVELTSWGAGVRRITLAEHDELVTLPGDQRDAYIMTHKIGETDENPGAGIPTFAARFAEINGQTVDLFSKTQWTVGNIVKTNDAESATLIATVLDADDVPVAEITRTFALTRGSYGLRLTQNIRNLTDAPLSVRFDQYAQGDLIRDHARYLGDRRLVATGYFDLSWDPSRNEIRADGSALLSRMEVADTYAKPVAQRTYAKSVWPNPELQEKDKNTELAWLACENRYFAIVTHAIVPEDATTTAEVPALEATFPHLGTVVFPSEAAAPNLNAEDRHIIFTLGTNAIEIAPQAEADLSLAVYAGPRDPKGFKQFPYDLLALPDLIRYEISCTWLTSQTLAKGLLGFLRVLEGYVVFDWGVAIICLVLVVRLILHPITKRAQFNMMKLGKAMQQMQPELEKLKKKYKDDPTKLNQEMMKLYREKGVNPANALGCLPMFLQMPIWVALYAMLYFAIELRHQPAFYGIFQTISGGHWHFLADLSTSDNFIRFVPMGEQGFELTWIPMITLHFAAINILPILRAVVFFFQQKLTMPPPANEQAAQQQKMMRIMVFLFPVFLYSAPAGLTLYILASTLAGIVDSYIVRRHLKKMEESGELFKPKPPKENGLFARIQKIAAEKQAMIEEMQKAQQQQQGNRPAKRRKR